MMKVISIAVFIVTALGANAQTLKAHDGVITFFSDAPLEDIKATNSKVSSAFNETTGEIAFAMKIADFQFPKKLMQQHFNEKYLESHKYPKSTFSGKIEGYNPAIQGKQVVQAKGKLTIHGVTHDIDVSGTILNNPDKLNMTSTFMVGVADYDIRIPQLVWQNIAERVEVTVNISFPTQGGR